MLALMVEGSSVVSEYTCVELVLLATDSSDLEVAAGLAGNTRVFYHHGQVCKGAES